ncbi:hypothetical protein Tco_0712533 [Tanacetum coccineum]
MSGRGNSITLQPWSLNPLSPIASLPEAIMACIDKHGPLHGFDMCIAKNEEVVRIDRNFAVDDVSDRLSNVETVEEGDAIVAEEGGILALAEVIKDDVAVIITAAVSPLFNKFTEVKVSRSQGILLDEGYDKEGSFKELQNTTTDFAEAMVTVSREDALAFVIDVTNWNFLLKRLVYRYQNLTIAFSSGLRSKQYYSLDGCRDQRAANKYGSFNVVLDLAQSYDLAFLTHLRSIQKRYFYWDDTSYICQQMTKAHMEDFLYLAVCSTLCWSLSVFDIVLVVELLMLLMTSVVICAITDDVTVNLHRTVFILAGIGEFFKPLDHVQMIHDSFLPPLKWRF